MPEQKRLTALKCNIVELASGQYIKQEGFNPNYMLTKQGRKLSRVRIMAVVVNKYVSENKQYAAITLDDATDTIRAKMFKVVSISEDVGVGDMVDVIGKVREWNQEIYIIPEIVYKIIDPNWMTLRRIELKEEEKKLKRIHDLVYEYKNQTSDLEELKKIMQERFHISPDQVETILMSDEMEEEKTANKKELREEVLKLIDKLDTGKGADYQDIIEQSSLSENDIDSIINELLSEGICFEPKPGKIKRL